MAVDPFRDVDQEARETTATLLKESHAALGVLDPETGAPVVTRIAVAAMDGALLTLISTLSSHTAALAGDPRCSLLLGVPGLKGDPLTHPRLTIQARAAAVDKAPYRERWLALRPKATLYFDFTDFGLMRFEPVSAALNGGFGKAYRLSATEILGILADQG